MKPDIWMPMYWADFLADTLHLSRAEIGSYILMIGAYWRRGSPLPDDDESLRNICRCNTQEWARCKGTMAAFFQVQNGEWRHKRIEIEMAEAIANAQANRDRTAAATAARLSKHVTDNVTSNVTSNATFTPSPSPSPSKEFKAFKALKAFDVGEGLEDPNAKRLDYVPLETESEFMDACRKLFGREAMKQYGGAWRTRWRSAQDKCTRVMRECLRAQLEGESVKHWAAYANDLFGRFK